MPVHFTNTKYKPKASINLDPEKEYRVLAFLGLKKEWGEDNRPLPYTDWQQQQISNIFNQMQKAGIDISVAVYEKNDAIDPQTNQPDVKSYPCVGRIQPLFVNTPYKEKQSDPSVNHASDQEGDDGW